MRFQKVLSYALYAVIIFGALIAGSWVAWTVKVWVGRTYKPVPGLFSFSAIYITVGILLGLEHLVMEFRKSGKWSVHKTKLIIMGIPSAIFAFYLELTFGFSLTLSLPEFIWGTNLLFNVSGIIFGYILATSFYKKANQLTAHSDKDIPL